MTGQTFGKYRVLERIGRGGMGTVYRAVDEMLQREVAIKVLNPELNDPDVATRFRNEAVTVARANHPGIATIHELFQHESQLFMVMEYVRGETLEALVNRIGPLALNHALQLVIQTLSALHHAHRLGIIHRDLKPANLMVTEGGLVKIMDFGIARLAGTENLTISGYMMGTPAYMAPEQVLGKPVDARVDLYALGVVLYRLITARLPFKGDTAFLMAQSQVNDAPTPLRVLREGIPAWLDPIMDRALAKNPDSRFQTADEFRLALERYESSLQPAATELTLAPDLAVTTAPGSVPSLSTTPQPGVPTALFETTPPRTGATKAATAAVVSTTTKKTPAAAPAVEKADTVVLKKGHLAWGGGAIAALLIAIVAIAVFIARRETTPPPPSPEPVADVAELVYTGAPPYAPYPRAIVPRRPPPTSAVAPVASDLSADLAASTTPPPATNATAGAPVNPAATKPDQETVTTEPVKPPDSPKPARPSHQLLAFTDVRVLVVTGTRGREQDAILNLAEDRIAAVATPQGSILKTIPYGNVTRATYSRSDDPRWQPDAATPPEKLDLGGSFLRRARHWLTLQAADDYLILRLDDSNWTRILSTIETRTGVTVLRTQRR